MSPGEVKTGEDLLAYQRELASQPDRGKPVGYDKSPTRPEPSIKFMCCTKKVTELHGPQGVLKDEEGFLICPEHRERRYGWKTTRAVVGTQAARHHGETDLERDQIIWREMFEGDNA